MKSQDKTKEQLLEDIRQYEFEISEFKKAANHYQKIGEALIQERELYADLANALPAGIYRLRVFNVLSLLEEKWTSTNDAPYTIEFANDRFFEILKLDRLAFEKNPAIINNYIFEEDKAEFARLNVEANKYVTPFIWEGRFNVKDKTIWIHFESIPRVLENGDIIWTGTLNDVSTRKNSELNLASKNQELETLNAEKVKFLSIIAHDLRSHFNAIKGFSELLVEHSNAKEYESTGKFATIILHSSKKAMDLLMNLMEWAQSKTGRMEFNPENIEMMDFIHETILSYTDIAEEKSITIKKDLPHNLSVFADKTMITIVFRNLITNAIKFTMPSGEVILSVVDKQTEIVFSLRDTGVGIPKKNIGKLFRIDQFYSTTGTNKEIGTGLGLILCKEFIEKHNGKIWVESEVGKGSTFYFSIPCNAQQ